MNPYAGTNPLVYNGAWTGGDNFRAMAFVIRVMCLDTHPELVAAWKELIRAGLPPEAIAAMSDMSVVAYPQLKARIIPALTSKNKVDEIRLANELAGQFRAQYARAAELARSAR